MSKKGVTSVRRSAEPMEPISLALTADLVIELDRMIEIGAAKSRAEAACLLMRKGMET